MLLRHKYVAARHRVSEIHLIPVFSTTNIAPTCWWLVENTKLTTNITNLEAKGLLYSDRVVTHYSH